MSILRKIAQIFVAFSEKLKYSLLKQMCQIIISRRKNRRYNNVNVQEFTVIIIYLSLKSPQLFNLMWKIWGCDSAHFFEEMTKLKSILRSSLFVNSNLVASFKDGKKFKLTFGICLPLICNLTLHTAILTNFLWL